MQAVFCIKDTLLFQAFENIFLVNKSQNAFCIVRMRIFREIIIRCYKKIRTGFRNFEFAVWFTCGKFNISICIGFDIINCIVTFGETFGNLV